jgi:ABC-type oligopeptide transport system ATPase subunit
MSDGFHAATGGTSPLLAVEGLTKVYPTGKKALDGIDVVIDQPQLVAVIGSSGAGKSTFIRCINRLVEPTAGRILLNGEDIVALDRKGLRAARRRIANARRQANLESRRQAADRFEFYPRLLFESSKRTGHDDAVLAAGRDLSRFQRPGRAGVSSIHQSRLDVGRGRTER